MEKLYCTLNETLKTDRTIQPQPGGQTEFISRPEFEVLGGGSAGGGKSFILVLDALGLQYEAMPDVGVPAINVPGYRAVLFRRETPQLAKLMDIAKELYPHAGGKWFGHRKGEPGPGFEFAPNAKIFFAHLEHETDKENHQGLEYQFVGFDELTHFTITQYLYLFSRLRTTLRGIKPRIRSTTNPTGVGLWWVKKRFINNQTPRVVGRFIADEKPELNPQGIPVTPEHPGYRYAKERVFVPLWLYENRILMEADPEYGSRIMQMGSQMEKALLGGDWDAFGGEFFPDFNSGRDQIDPFYIPKDWQLIGSIDPGYSSPCSFGLTAVAPNGTLYRVATYYEWGRSPIVHAAAIRKFIDDQRWTGGRFPDMIVSGTDAWAKKDRFGIIQHDRTFADEFQSQGLVLIPANTDRIQGWWSWKKLMPNHYKVFKGLNDPLVEEMVGAVPDEKRPEDIAGLGNAPEVRDHSLDEQRYGVQASKTPVQDTETVDSPSWAKLLVPKRGHVGEKRIWKPGMR